MVHFNRNLNVLSKKYTLKRALQVNVNKIISPKAWCHKKKYEIIDHIKQIIK